MSVICQKCLAELKVENWDVNQLGTLYVEQEVLANGAILWKTNCTKNKDHTTTWQGNPQKHVIAGCTQKTSKEELIEEQRKRGIINLPDWFLNTPDNWQTKLICSECAKKNCDEAIEKWYDYVSIKDSELATYDPKLLFHEHGLGNWKTDYPMHPILRKHRQNKTVT